MATEVKKETASSKPQTRSGEIAAIVLLALAVLVFLCLVTHNPNDWSLNTASSQPTQNWVGIFGSVVSDLLFQIIGLTAYFVPVLLALIAWRVFQTKVPYPSVGSISGYLFFVVSASSLFSLIGWRGGLLGAFFAQNLAWLLGTIGAAIVLTAIFAASLLLITNLTFGAFSGSIDLAMENLRIRLNEWRDKRREARKQAIIEREEKIQAAPPVEKTNKPTISVGETLPDKAKEKTVRQKAASVFGRFTEQPEKAEEKPEIIEEPIIEEIEEFTPTISVSEKSEPQLENQIPIENKRVDLIGEAENIPITPMQHTGELDAEFLEEKEEEAQPKEPQNYDDYLLPSPEFLSSPPPHLEQKDEELLSIAKELTEKTQEFNVTGSVKHICQGPVVTTYEFKPDPGVKYSRVTGLVDDLCLALKAESIRIDRIPGKAYVGIEVPNRQRETIFLREVVESKKFQDSNSLLTIALGKKIDGLNYIADLAKMPHLLIAGATGAGKSVGVNTLVVSILYKAKPDEVKFIMVDPKRLELGLYADIPHLATPIITDPKRAAISLKWAVSEMERRYKDLAGWGVRNIDGYNTEVKRKNALEQFDDNGEPHRPLPYIVI
ncbi:MAG TPA: DNA translocase FtsK 4TM domain-containing protein, partial [Pyrinomonadaceae bacterium]|nr:DNA translocase FtsK 4TM domain-containing protein [Pyrinomonadaceae bacterium]